MTQLTRIFERNMALLRERDSSLAEAIARMPVQETTRVLKTRSGHPTVLWTPPSQKPKFLHSPVDPVLESRSLVEDRFFGNRDGTLLFGFGLGYLAREIRRKKEPHHLLCIMEALPGLFRLAMEHADLSDLLTDAETHFFIGDRVSGLVDGFRPLRLKAISGSLNRLALPGFLEIYDGFYNEMESRLHEYVNSLRQSYSTLLANRDSVLSNLFRNIPAILKAVEADRLRDLLRGRPAVIVAAGPSLSKDLEALKEVHDRCFLIGVDTALKPLLKQGVLPDLVVTCDPHPTNFRKIEGLSDPSLNTRPLLFSADANPQIVAAFNSVRFVAAADTSLSRWLLNKGRRVMTLPSYGTVSHLGFLVARLMGADPIIFVGLDLSFPGPGAHAEGCTAPWGLDETTRDFILVPANSGSQVKTLAPFVSMIRQFEKDIQKTPARCINVSRDGALIRGAPWMPLEKSVNSNGDTPERAIRGFSVDLLEQAVQGGSTNWKEDLHEALKWLLSEVKNMEGALPSGNPPIRSGDDTMNQTVHSCFRQRSLLNALFDCFPRYLLSFHALLEGEFPEPDSVHLSSRAEQVALFVEEARDVIPLIRTHCEEALRGLSSAPC